MISIAQHSLAKVTLPKCTSLMSLELDLAGEVYRDQS